MPKSRKDFWTNITVIVAALIGAAATALTSDYVTRRLGGGSDDARKTAFEEPARREEDPAPRHEAPEPTAPRREATQPTAPRPAAYPSASQPAPDGDTSRTGESPAPGSPPPLINWSRTAQAERRSLGKVLAFRCPPDGKIEHVAGTNPYSFGSSICSAAVHGGVISTGAGGVVRIRMLGVQDRFEGARQNDVTSKSQARPTEGFDLLN